jgi:hypothetical protein
MIEKRLLVPQRLRRPPKSGWSWVDRGFVREHAEHLSREAILLYFFLTAAADRNGLSFYSDGSIAALLRLTLPTLLAAREELVTHDLIAHEPPLTQVLSLPLRSGRRRRETGEGLFQLGELFRQLGASPAPSTERRLP